MAELKIPEPAGSILARVMPIMLNVFQPSEITLGGGTALAARWHHRVSTDIDIFVPYEAFRRAAGEWGAPLTESGAVKVAGGQVWLTGIFPEGDFSVAATDPFLPICGRSIMDHASGWDVALEEPAEVLAKKLRLRMYGNGEFVSRDFYDICTAAEEAPSQLQRALSALSPRQRDELEEEIRGFVGRAHRLDRPLLNVHRPEWLNGLAVRTANLVLNGPTPEPAPEDSMSPGF